MNNKKTLLIIAGVALGVIILVLIVSLFNQGTGGSIGERGENPANRVAPINLDTEVPVATPEEVMDAQSDVQGASKVVENVVVTPAGTPAKNDATPGSSEAPQQTPPLTEEDIPEHAVKMTISSEGFVPDQFTVKPGQVVTLSLTSIDGATHVFLFDDQELSAVAIGIGPNETRAITFNAPASGEYGFHCDVPGHTARGEAGKMIVQ